ncbi:MAG: hypothetical protein GX931_06620 [Acholeplasmataceae bacterium]|nr:hypothetical protein [Acholeplasmataceae bacterium]
MREKLAFYFEQKHLYQVKSGYNNIDFTLKSGYNNIDFTLKSGYKNIDLGSFCVIIYIGDGRCLD